MSESDDERILEMDPLTIQAPPARAEVIFVQWHYDSEAGVEVPEARDYARRLMQRLDEAGLDISFHHRSYITPPNPLDIGYWDLELTPPGFAEEAFLRDVREYLQQHPPWGDGVTPDPPDVVFDSRSNVEECNRLVREHGERNRRENDGEEQA